MPKPTSSTVLSLSDLADGRAGADLLAEDASVREPLLFVNLDTTAPDPGQLLSAAATARDCDRLLVGIADSAPTGPMAQLAEALDLTLLRAPQGPPYTVPLTDPWAAAETLSDAVAAAPQSAVVLGRLLRVGEQMTVRDALDIESLAYSTLLGGPDFARWLAARGQRPAPPPAVHPPVLVHRQESLLHVTLNRPERRNAHGAELRDALVAGLRIAELDPTVAEVLLDGAGPSFCAGGDLDEFGTAPDLTTAHLIRTTAGAARLLHALRDRVSVRLHGHCVGAGIELAAFAARITATPDTVIRLPELAMGLIPGAGGTVSVPRRVGRWRALHLMLTGQSLDAATAHAWGLVDHVEPRP